MTIFYLCTIPSPPFIPPYARTPIGGGTGKFACPQTADCYAPMIRLNSSNSTSLTPPALNTSPTAIKAITRKPINLENSLLNPNNTNLSDTEMNDNKSNQIVSADENRSNGDNSTEEYQAYEKLVKEIVDYESLEVTHHDDMRQVDEIVNLIVETVMCKNDKILIASNWYPASLVKKKFLMLTYSHIEYVLHCMSGNTTKVKNIKKYLLAALFNAPSTMNGYYQAEVNHDMPGLVR